MSRIEFDQKFFKLESMLLAFAHSLTKDRDDAQDLYQETAYKAFRYRDKFQPTTNFKAWILTIMRNTFINGYRSKRRRQTILDSSDNDYLLNSTEVTLNLGEGNIMQEEIVQAIETLEDKLRLPFLMQFQGYAYEEIAEHLGIPIGTVKSRIHFARKTLRDQLSHWYQAQDTKGILA